jgi:hypothetical protein
VEGWSALDPAEVEVAFVDDLAVDGGDEDFLGPDLDDGGDVLVGVVLGQHDLLTEEVQDPVGADVADDFDLAPGRQAGRSLVSGCRWVAQPSLPDFVGAVAAVGAVAVMGVVGGDERLVLPGQVLDPAESFPNWAQFGGMAPRKLEPLSSWAITAAAAKVGRATGMICESARCEPTSIRLTAWNSTAPSTWRGPTMSIWWVVPGSGATRVGYRTPLGT